MLQHKSGYAVDRPNVCCDIYSEYETHIFVLPALKTDGVIPYVFLNKVEK